ncbi:MULTISPECIES: hypothetical protein [Actinoalloteichus]|uniref:Uncharacterized protein n=1 Tax=Actinoalloteichus fjordicus TaxID=1612552 RepID=A0AAC9PTH7_9PSEU|nr:MULTISPECIES: hypothetical protein [Actinoalloteichus]APU16070.1 hypothetical protein UA74_20225 [Actinoalloteichus fjordicus]APU22135.1 hypothetical protein UA75_20730 [Actinoalloteichus sp. GBA129-24]
MTGLGPWFVRTVDDGGTHRADHEHWTADGRARIRPICEPTAEFTAINREPIAVPYFDEHRCPRCLADALDPAAPRPRHLVLVR